MKYVLSRWTAMFETGCEHYWDSITQKIIEWIAYEVPKFGLFGMILTGEPEKSSFERFYESIQSLYLAIRPLEVGLSLALAVLLIEVISYIHLNKK